MKNVKHIPFNSARKSVPREVLYLNAWREYAETLIDVFGEEDKITNFVSIFSHSDVNPQRAAMVAASFVTFMGCNAGQSFTNKATEFYRKVSSFMTRENAFLSVWAIENRRTLGINNNSILMECVVGRSVDGGLTKVNINKLTVEDLEIMNVMVSWWSSDDAKKLREGVEGEAKRQVAEILDNLYSPKIKNSNDISLMI